MKKTLSLLIAILAICLTSTFVLGACDIEDILNNADFTENYSSTDKNGTVDLINAFLEETLKNTDFVVRYEYAGELQYTQYVKDGATYILSKTGAKTYVYKVGDIYYWVSVDMQENEKGEMVESRNYLCSDRTKDYYYQDMESIYDTNFYQFISEVKMFAQLPEEDGASFSCQSDAEKTDGVITATLNAKYTNAKGTYEITAASENDLVQTINIKLITDNVQENRNVTITFEYGKAQFDLPDVDAWAAEAAQKAARIEANEQAIEDRDEFLSAALYADNVKVTVTDAISMSVNLTETIANDIDCVDYGTYKTYTYFVEVDEFDTDAYFVYDGETKYYVKNGDVFGDNNYVWYYKFISVYDELSETAVFAYRVENNSMTYTVTVDNKTIYSIAASYDNGKIANISVTGYADDDSFFMKAIVLEYNTSELNVPDLTDFTDNTVADDADIA